MKAFTSPSGFYAVEHPNDWNDSREENIVNICPPDESGAVTLSAYHGSGATLEVGLQVFTNTFKDYTVLSSWQPAVADTWTGFTAEFAQSDATSRRIWLATCAHRKAILVLVTANDIEVAMQFRRPIYQAILDSLVIPQSEAGDD